MPFSQASVSDLRIVADGLHTEHGVFADDDRLAMKFLALFQEGRKSRELKPLHDNPFHVASAVLGTSVFYVAALATLVPHARFEPLDPEQVAALQGNAGCHGNLLTAAA